MSHRALRGAGSGSLALLRAEEEKGRSRGLKCSGNGNSSSAITNNEAVKNSFSEKKEKDDDGKRQGCCFSLDSGRRQSKRHWRWAAQALPARPALSQAVSQRRRVGQMVSETKHQNQLSTDLFGAMSIGRDTRSATHAVFLKPGLALDLSCSRGERAGTGSRAARPFSGPSRSRNVQQPFAQRPVR